jgi:hypothetical protein
MGEASIEDYGRIRRCNKILLMHRVTFAVSRGMDPFALSPAVCVRHECDTKPCCNPEHLIEGTWPDNVRDSIVRGRHAVAYRMVDGRVVGLCKHGHDLSVVGVHVSSNGHRCCLACRRRISRESARRIRGSVNTRRQKEFV